MRGGRKGVIRTLPAMKKSKPIRKKSVEVIKAEQKKKAKMRKKAKVARKARKKGK
jgi:hypothetical protein